MDYKSAVRHQAEKFRYTHGLGLNSPIDFPGFLDALNILTVFKPLSPTLSGITGKVRHLMCMLINSSHTVGRQNFTIAHELYHLFFDDDFDRVVIDSNVDMGSAPSSMREKRANAFASALILPDGFIDLIPHSEQGKNRVSVPTLVRIEQYYRCSRNALLLRLKELRLADEEYVQRYGKNIISHANLLGYDTSLYLPGRDNKVLGEYASLAMRLYENDIISESNLYAYLMDIGIDPEYGDCENE